jgi:toluene monooxygenase electron transfer component
MISSQGQPTVDYSECRSLMMPRICVRSEQETVILECGLDETLLSAALRAGVGVPYECCSGICGTCRFEIVAGEVRSQWPDAPGLSPRDRRLHRQLACQSRPLTDCVIRLRLDERYIPAIKPQRMTGVLRSIEPVTRNIRRVTISTGCSAEYLPGQFVLFHLADVTSPRAYSMSNTPNDEGAWEFYIKQIPDGEFTRTLFSKTAAGAPLELEGPYGMAFLRQDSNRPVLCVAGGSGISPMLSIARALAHDHSARPIHFYIGGRAPDDVSSLISIVEAACGAPTFHIGAAVSDEESTAEWNGKIGLIHALVERDLAARLKDFDIYLAGPPPMVQACLAMLSRCEVAADRVHYDAY